MVLFAHARIEPEADGPIVDQRDLHVRTECSLCHRRAALALQRGNKASNRGRAISGGAAAL